MTPDERLRIDNEIEEKLRGHFYKATNWAVVTAVIFFGVPIVAMLAISVSGAKSGNIPEFLGLWALIIEGIVYWLARRGYYKAFQKERDIETWTPDASSQSS